MTRLADLTAEIESLVKAEGMGAISNHSKKNRSVFDFDLKEIKPSGKKMRQGRSSTPV